jgi:hypothetical protein
VLCIKLSTGQHNPLCVVLALLCLTLSHHAVVHCCALLCVQAYVLANAVSKDQVSALLDMSGQLLADNNFKVMTTTVEEPQHMLH